MNIRYLVAELEAERNRLDHAISTLEGLTSSARRLGRTGRENLGRVLLIAKPDVAFVADALRAIGARARHVVG